MAGGENSLLVGTITELCNQTASGTGIEIAEVQLRGSGKARLLRIYIDKPGGVSHGDCQLISERLGQVLDEQDVIPDDSYTLEVSSLGPDRRLVTARDFERIVGLKVAVMLRPVMAPGQEDGERPRLRERVEGKVVRVDSDVVELQPAGGEPVLVPLEQIGKAKLKFEP
jgi:ribosome maturation factor RimP